MVSELSLMSVITDELKPVIQSPVPRPATKNYGAPEPDEVLFKDVVPVPRQDLPPVSWPVRGFVKALNFETVYALEMCLRENLKLQKGLSDYPLAGLVLDTYEFDRDGLQARWVDKDPKNYNVVYYTPVMTSWTGKLIGARIHEFVNSVPNDGRNGDDSVPEYQFIQLIAIRYEYNPVTGRIQLAMQEDAKPTQTWIQSPQRNIQDNNIIYGREYFSQISQYYKCTSYSYQNFPNPKDILDNIYHGYTISPSYLHVLSELKDNAAYMHRLMERNPKLKSRIEKERARAARKLIRHRPPHSLRSLFWKHYYTCGVRCKDDYFTAMLNLHHIPEAVERLFEHGLQQIWAISGTSAFRGLSKKNWRYLDLLPFDKPTPKWLIKLNSALSNADVTWIKQSLSQTSFYDMADEERPTLEEFLHILWYQVYAKYQHRTQRVAALNLILNELKQRTLTKTPFANRYSTADHYKTFSLKLNDLEDGIHYAKKLFGTRKYRRPMWELHINGYLSDSLSRNWGSFAKIPEAQSLVDRLRNNIKDAPQLRRKLMLGSLIHSIMDSTSAFADQFPNPHGGQADTPKPMFPLPKRLKGVGNWLSTNQLLKHYGSKFHHCLSSYGYNWKNHYWFIRYGDAVAELSLDNNGRLFIVQNHGPYNRDNENVTKLNQLLKPRLGVVSEEELEELGKKHQARKERMDAWYEKQQNRLIERKDELMATVMPWTWRSPTGEFSASVSHTYAEWTRMFHGEGGHWWNRGNNARVEEAEIVPQRAGGNAPVAEPQGDNDGDVAAFDDHEPLPF